MLPVKKNTENGENASNFLRAAWWLLVFFLSAVVAANYRRGDGASWRLEVHFVAGGVRGGCPMAGRMIRSTLRLCMRSDRWDGLSSRSNTEVDAARRPYRPRRTANGR